MPKPCYYFQSLRGAFFGFSVRRGEWVSAFGHRIVSSPRLIQVNDRRAISAICFKENSPLDRLGEPGYVLLEPLGELAMPDPLDLMQGTLDMLILKAVSLG